MIPVCPELTPREIKTITDTCFGTSHQIDPKHSGQQAVLVAVTEKPDDLAVCAAVESLSRQFSLLRLGNSNVIAAPTIEAAVEQLQRYGVRYRHDGHILVLAPPHEQGRCWRYVKSQYHPGARVHTQKIAGYFDRDTWPSVQAARNAVWREACTLASIVCEGALPRMDCDGLIEIVETYCPRQECAA